MTRIALGKAHTSTIIPIWFLTLIGDTSAVRRVSYLILTPNAAFWAHYFQTQAVLNIYISIQKQSDVVVPYLNVAYFSFQIPPFCLLLSYRSLPERGLVTCESIVNCDQRVSCQ